LRLYKLETGTGFSSARIWVNSTVTPRVYFGNFAIGDIAIADGNNAALDICGAYDSISSNLVSTVLTGAFDILNLLWIEGSEGLFQNSSGIIFVRSLIYSLFPRCKLSVESLHCCRTS
jgi:hypothetical protein